MKLIHKLSTVALSFCLCLATAAWAQSADPGSSRSTDRPTDPSPTRSSPALDPTDVQGSGTQRGVSTMRSDFASVDTDGDGRISRSEFASSSIGGNVRAGTDAGMNDPVTNKPRSNSAATTDAGANKNASTLFRDLDRNGDGYLSKTEFDAYKSTDRDTSGATR
ncbi:MAG TPA: EF-hand domain-containing protein [Lacunisphaera sp.]|nr:EF-hand domain-containing protein [Lacunisphaera sp.]